MLGYKVPPLSKCVRIDVHFFSFSIEPLMEEEFELDMLSLCDYKLSFVPDYFINFLIRKFPFNLIKN